MKTDDTLLADVFENFRKVCMENNIRDPAHYYTAHGLSWDGRLKKTGIELELLIDLCMHLFIEKDKRGGPTKLSKFITYLDANNLYGHKPSAAQRRHQLKESDAHPTANHKA